MRIGVLGTGEVGRTIATRLAGDGHHVVMGSRSAANETAAGWVAATDGATGHGTFADAAHDAQLVVNATSGDASLAVMGSIPAGMLDGTVVLDVANPLDFSGGFPPTLTMCNTTSLGEQIQRAVPRARVVKALNTMHNSVMVDPWRVAGDHHVFICGDDDDAKRLVCSVISPWGWDGDAIIDLGDITNARATEMMLPLWVRLYGALGTPEFNFGVARRATRSR